MSCSSSGPPLLPLLFIVFTFYMVFAEQRQLVRSLFVFTLQTNVN